MVKARFINDTHTVNVRSIGSATSHEQLIHRDLPEQHPISAITGLTEALAGQTTDLQAEVTRATEAESALNTAISNEVTRATEAEEQLSSDIQAENTRALNAEETLDDKISAETTARQNADNAEETRAKGVESGLRTDLTTEVTARQNADNNLQGQITTNANDIDSIESKIPAQASANNQLADKDFVNSSIATNTATFRGTYNSVEDLEAYSGEKDNNDYAFVTGVDSLGNTYYDNYVYNGSAWVKRYRLNNSTFTASQWAAINSNATSENIAQITTNANAINAINNTLNGYGDVVTHNVNEFATSAQGAKADTALQPAALNGYATESYVDTGLSGKADKSTTYTKTEVDTIASGKANVGLDNLNATGQMIIDSVNGYISNCILEIPQNIKVTLKNGLLTVKSGSELALCKNSTYTTRTLTQDYSRQFLTSGWGTNKQVILWYWGSTGVSLSNYPISKISSGATTPESLTNENDLFFNTTDLTIYQWRNGSMNITNYNYPLCVLENDNGTIKYAKDSNGNDMIFNGAGFIGHHAFVYPNVKALLPNGFNDDKILNSLNFISNKLTIFELNADNNALLCNRYSTNFFITKVGIDLNYTDDIQDTFTWHYIKTLNKFSRIANNNLQEEYICLFVKYSITGTTVTDFTIRQPVRLATTEMLDKVQEQVATKQVDVTTLTGYDSTQTQTLKNINGVLTWVTD